MSDDDREGLGKTDVFADPGAEGYTTPGFLAEEARSGTVVLTAVTVSEETREWGAEELV